MTPDDRKKLLIREIEDLTSLLDTDGLMVHGSQGQPRAHPAIQLRHAAMEALRKLEAQYPAQDGPSALEEFLSEHQGRPENR